MPFDLEKYFIFSPLFANNENLSEKERHLINEKAEKLTTREREYIVDPKTAKTMEDTMSTFNLTEKQAIVLSVLVRRIFLRDSSKKDLINDIIKYVNVDQQLAGKLVNYLEENVFSNIPEPLSDAVKKPGTEGNVLNLKNK